MPEWSRNASPVPALCIDRLRQAPLVPYALAVALGLVLDRVFVIPFALTMTGALLLGLFSVWADARRVRVYRYIAVVLLAAAYHHHQRYHYPADDVATFAIQTATPAMVRGELLTQPLRVPATSDPMIAIPRGPAQLLTLDVRQLRFDGEWQSASGRLQVRIVGEIPEYQLGDIVEVTGKLRAFSPASNPGQRDYRDHALDQRLRATLDVPAENSLVRWQSVSPWHLFARLAQLQQLATQRLDEAMPDTLQGLARALLVGDGHALAREDWQKYQHTGIVHVLVISGQHLTLMAIFLSLMLTLCGCRRSYVAWSVTALTFGYALLSGGNPSAIRAAVMVMIVNGAILLQRRCHAANALALTWLVIALFDPTDPFTAGCQLSFIGVMLLVGGVFRYVAVKPLSPLEQLIDESRPVWSQLTRLLASWGRDAYLLAAVIGFGLMPLLAYHTHLLAPVGILIGPPVVLLSSIALVSGFFFLLAQFIGEWLAWPFLRVTEWALQLINALAQWGESLPAAYGYVSDVPVMWVIAFYAILAMALLLPSVHRERRWIDQTQRHLGWAFPALVILLFMLPLFESRDSLRVTVLDVGHGSATVIETSDGRVMLYDAGALNGPEVTQRIIAPFLWSRGYVQIDQVILSHADLDHINGLPALLDRFRVDGILSTRAFGSHSPRAAQHVRQLAAARHIPWQTVEAGHGLDWGDARVVVLHPATEFRGDTENGSSLILLMVHQGHRLLLTGDIADAGLTALMKQNITPVDVVLAPHHGSYRSNGPDFAGWCRPRWVVSSQRRTERLASVRALYQRVQAEMWSTSDHGAITIRSDASGVSAESHLTGDRVVVTGSR